MTFSNSNFSRKTGISLAATAIAVCLPLAISAQDSALVPADKFDLSHWNITVPIDKNKDGKADIVPVKKLKKYAHPDFFYLDDQGRMVFASPNKAQTTKNSSNTRSELRYMLRGKDTRIKTHSAVNNFAVEARKDSDKFGSVGGRMDATLHVDHVALRAGDWEEDKANGDYAQATFSKLVVGPSTPPS